MIYHVYANRSNIGDWLAARAIQSQLAPRPLRELLCDQPFVAKTIQVLRGAAESDAVVIGGGGLFMDYFLPFWSEFNEIARHSDVPYFIWGVGICDHKQRFSRLDDQLLEQIVRRSRLCVVRDELTYEALGIPELPLPVPCPSMLLVERLADKSGALLHAVHYEMTGPSGYEELRRFLQQEATRRERRYLETNNEIEPDDSRALQAELKLYRDAVIAVSSRLHGCIIGVASGCRVIAVSGDRKVESFMRAAGLEQWVCKVGDFTGLERLLERADEQKMPVEFLYQTRQENIQVGRRIAAAIDDIHRTVGRLT